MCRSSAHFLQRPADFLRIFRNTCRFYAHFLEHLQILCTFSLIPADLLHISWNTWRIYCFKRFPLVGKTWWTCIKKKPNDRLGTRSLICILPVTTANAFLVTSWRTKDIRAGIGIEFGKRAFEKKKKNDILNITSIVSAHLKHVVLGEGRREPCVLHHDQQIFLAQWKKTMMKT